MNNEYVYELTAFFLEAAGKCYAGDQPKTTIVDLPKSKVYRYEKDDLLYVDTYFTNGENSGGQTTIFENDVPVWLMQYHGWCKNDDPQILDFLKAALQESYSKGLWSCGRGPEYFKDETRWPNLYYSNIKGIQGLESFSNFYSIEGIGPDFGDYFFWHRIQGMLLAKPD